MGPTGESNDTSLVEARLELDGAVRHGAILVSAVLAYAYADRSKAVLPCTLSVVVAVNFASVLLSRYGTKAIRQAVRFSAPVFAVGCWGALVCVTTGAAGESSPFVAGLWFEIVLSSAAGARRAIAVTTGLAVVSFWLAHVFVPLRLASLAVHSGFFVALAVATDVVRRRWLRSEAKLSVALEAQSDQRRELECQLEEARALGERSERAVAACHELKNAVYGIRGFTRLLQRSSSGTSEGQTVAALNRAVDRLEELAKGTLRPDEAGSVILAEATAAELARVINDCAHELSAAFPNVACRLDIESSAQGLAFPSSELRAVVWNLLLNAAQSMQGTGEVVVQARSEAGRWRVFVSDAGPGLIPSKIKNVFRPGCTTKAGGSGLGLYLCRRLVEARGGRLTVVPAEKGARFVVDIPAGG